MGATVTAAVIMGISALGASKMSSDAAKRAGRMQQRSTTDAISWEQQQEKRRQEEYDRTEQANEERWKAEVAREQRNADRVFAEEQHRDRRKEPYRVAGVAAMEDLDRRRQASMRDLVGVGRI